MGKKKKKEKKENKGLQILPLEKRGITVSFTQAFGEYGNNKIFILQSGTIPDDSSKTDVDYTMEEMFNQVKDKVEELGERVREDQDYYND